MNVPSAIRAGECEQIATSATPNPPPPAPVAWPRQTAAILLFVAALTLAACSTDAPHAAGHRHGDRHLSLGVLPGTQDAGVNPPNDSADDTPPPAAAQPDDPPEPEDADGSGADAEREKRQYELIAPILLDDSANGDNSRRIAAAAELMAIGTPQAYGVLEQALRSGQTPKMLAVIRAMDASVDDVPQLLNAAVETLPTAPKEVQEPLWRMLAHHEQRVLDAVTTIALDADRPADQRVPAIGALGAFRTRTAAQRLIELLEPQRDEPQTITTAACAALSRLTGLPYGDEPENWLHWWTKARAKSREQWLFDQVQRLVRERGALERELVAQRRHTDRIEQRVVDTLRELFRALPNNIDRQLAPLPELLEDDLAVVRHFAIERIRFISRDLEIPRPLKEQVAARLDDADPTIRRDAARLLHDLSFADLNTHLANRLAAEPSTETARAYIAILQSRPTPAALEALTQRVREPALTEPACEALWATLVAAGGPTSVDPSLPDALREHFAALAEAHQTPVVLRLAALLCDADALPQYEAMLAQADPSVRRAIAQGFRARGHHQPLFEHVDDPAAYPSAMHAVTEAEPTTERLQPMLTMRPPNESLRSNWTEAITKLCTRMPPAALLEADKLLADVNTNAVNANGGNNPAAGLAEVRLDLLSNAAAMSAEQMPVELRRELLIRLATLRLALGQYQQAHDDLDTLAGADPSPELTRLKFRAAILSGRFDRAAGIQSEPAVWVELLDQLVDEQPKLARRLHQEIGTRFGEALDDEARTAWERIQRRLNNDGAANPSDASPAEAAAAADDAGG